MKNSLAKLFDRTFWKFILVGIANTIVGTGVMFLFYNVFHLSYWISSASNYLFGSIFSFVLNRMFTFQSKKNAGKTLPKFVLNITVCYLLAYGAAKPLVAWILSGLPENIQDNVAMLVGMCTFVGLNYIGQRYYVFDKNTGNDAEDSELSC